MSEAITIAARIISQFPNVEKAADGFTHALALVLADYSPQIAYACADPKLGIASEREFLSISAIVAWCERRVVNATRRIPSVPEQIGDWVDMKPTSRLKEMGKAWLDRTDPIAQQLSGQKPKGHVAEEAKKRIISQIGKEAFDALPNQP